MAEKSTELARPVKSTLDWLGEQAGVQVQKGPNGELLISGLANVEDKFNVLAPISQIAQLDRNFQPTIKTVSLTVGSDTYKQGFNKKDGELHALTRQGLMKLADLSGIEFIDEHIDYMGGAGVSIQVVGRRRGADGLWREHRATKTVWFERLERKIKREARETAAKYNKPEPTEDDLEKRVDDEMEHIVAKTETKAMNRVIRSFLSVKSTYTLPELRKPFFIIGYSFTPDSQDPNVKELIAANYGMATSDLYGEPKYAEGRTRVGIASRSVVDLTDSEDEDATAEPDIPDVAIAEETESSVWEVEEDEDAPEDADVLFPEPLDNFAFAKGPYAGQFVRDVVQTTDGQTWFAKVILKLKGDKREQGMAWLSWATDQEVNDDNIADLAK